MPKQRDKDGVEFWRGECRRFEKENRQLEKENRQLRKRLGQYEKSKHIYHDVITDYRDSLENAEVIEPKKKLIKCEECNKGVMEEFEIVGKTIGTCNQCGFRKRVK